MVNQPNFCNGNQWTKLYEVGDLVLKRPAQARGARNHCQCQLLCVLCPGKQDLDELKSQVKSLCAGCYLWSFLPVWNYANTAYLVVTCQKTLQILKHR